MFVTPGVQSHAHSLYFDFELDTISARSISASAESLGASSARLARGEKNAIGGHQVGSCAGCREGGQRQQRRRGPGGPDPTERREGGCLFLCNEPGRRGEGRGALTVLGRNLAAGGRGREPLRPYHHRNKGEGAGGKGVSPGAAGEQRGAVPP